MPLITIECNEAIAQILSFEDLVTQIHALLALKLPTELSHCKTRLQIASQYLIGNDPHQHFLIVTLKILTGRTTETKKEVAQQILLLLRQQLPLSNVSISLEMIEIESINYFKIKQ